jgi:hypothetical protein
MPGIETTLIEMNNFFKQLCIQTLTIDILKQMRVGIIVILYKMEQIFSSAFFDFMIYLVVHFPR